MPRPLYDQSLRQLIATNIEAGVGALQIAEYLRVSPGLVTYYRKKIAAFGAIDTPSGTVRGPKRKLHPAAEDSIIDQVAANPTIFLDELQVWLQEEWNITVSLPTIQRCLNRRGKSHKKTERRNEGQDSGLRAVWLYKISQFYKPNQLIVVDESAANERSKDRRWGWSERGVPCRADQTARASRWSILPAIGINGYLEYEIFHGSFNAERFENFIKKLLVKMNPFPESRSVLVMDNVSTHHSPLVLHLCRQAGVILEYLPPYSPDLSPIEESFSVLKAWMRRNRELAAPFADCYDLFLHVAIAQCNFRHSARNLFRGCGIDVSDEDTDEDYDKLVTGDEMREIEIAVGG